MQMLQGDEHAFYWGQPPASAPAGTVASYPAASAGQSAVAVLAADSEATTPGALIGTGPDGSGPSGTAPSFVQVALAPGVFHEIAGAATAEELLRGLTDALLEASAEQGLRGGEGEGCAAPPLALPPRVVEVAFAKTAGWALDAGSAAGTDPDTVRRLLGLLQSSLAASRLAGYSADEVGSVLWSLASVCGAYGWAASPATLAAVRGWLAEAHGGGRLAAEAGALGGLVSLLWGYAALLQAAGPGGAGEVGGGEAALQPVAVGPPHPQPPQQQGQWEADAAARGSEGCDPGPDVGPCLDALSRRAAELLALSHGSGQPVAGAELADLAWALAVIGRRSPASAQLAEAVAHEAYRLLSNRYSLQAAFAPPDLVKLVAAYAELRLRDGAVSRMLDAVGGHVAKRIRARHIHALTRPTDCAALLQAFADSEHSTVVVPELLAACALQISREVAAHNEAASASAAAAAARSSAKSSNTDAGPGGWGSGSVAERLRRPHVSGWRLAQPPSPEAAAAHWASLLPYDQAVAVLASYVRMGYQPGAVLLDSLLLAVLPQLPYVSPGAVSELLHLLAAVRHVPGHRTLELLAAAALRREAPAPPAPWVTPAAPPLALPGRAGGRHADAPAPGPVQRLRSLWALLMMGWQPGPGTDEVDEVLSAVLLDDSLALGGQDAGRLLSLLPLLPRGELTIQRFGLAALKLRDALGSGAAAAAGGGGAGRGGASRWYGDRHDGGSAAGASQGSAGAADPVLLAAGACMALLGREGWQMAEQLLPAATFRRAEAALRRALQQPYQGVDERCVADVVRALEDAGCSSVASQAQLHADAFRSDCCGSGGSASPSSGGADGGEADVRPDVEYGTDAEGLPAVDPLDCSAIVAHCPSGATATGTAAEDPGEAAAHVKVVVDVCMPHDYASNAPGRQLWGWARVRQALYTAGTAGRLLLLDERTLYSLQGNRERLAEYVGAELRSAVLTDNMPAVAEIARV